MSGTARVSCVWRHCGGVGLLVLLAPPNFFAPRAGLRTLVRLLLRKQGLVSGWKRLMTARVIVNLS